MNLCIYCQTNAANSRDHVPPRELFKPPRPSNLITVPACEACNRRYGLDDEYFLSIAMDMRAANMADAQYVIGSRMRSMNRPNGKGRGLWWPLFRTLTSVEICTTGGLYTGDTLAFRLDCNRLMQATNRYIRGLYFEVKKRKEMIPLGDCVRSMPLDLYLRDHASDPRATEFLGFVSELKGRTIGDGVFQFRYLMDDKPFGSFWFLEFYRRIAFVGFTRQEGDAFETDEEEPPIDTTST